MQGGVLPKTMFMMGMVTPAPMDVKTAAHKRTLSSHVEKEKMRCGRFSHGSQR